MESSGWAVVQLLLPLLLSCHAQRVKVREEVTGFAGQDVTLPCTFSPDDSNLKITQVTWMKEAGGKKTSVAVYNPNHGTSLPNSRISFVRASLQEPTLLIRSLMMSDEGTYTCEFATYPNGNEEGVTKLILLAEPNNYAEAINGIAGSGETTVANCTSANGKPKSEITWESSFPGNISTIVINNTDGTYTVNSQFKIFPTSMADGKTVTCIITCKTANVPQRIPVKLSIQYPPIVSITEYDDNWYINRPQAELRCAAHSNPPVTKYEWKLANGQALPSNVEAISNLLQVKTVDNNLNTTIICEATNVHGTVAQKIQIFVRATPNMKGAGATGSIIGGIIAAIIGIAVIATMVTVCRQQRKNQTAKDDDDLEGPPEYKPPPPSVKLQTQEVSSINKESVSEESVPLKPVALEYQPPVAEDMDMAKNPIYQDFTEDGNLEHSTHVPGTEDDYLEQINPIYNDLSYSSDMYVDKRGFVMSKAMYV